MRKQSPFLPAAFAACLLCAALPARAETPAFVSIAPDVPLMPGFSEMRDQAIAFDKPNGRIGESLAIAKPIPAESVRGFYRDTLPQLGWSAAREGGDSYVRGEDRLRIEIDAGAQRTAIRFTLTPLTKNAPETLDKGASGR